MKIIIISNITKTAACLAIASLSISPLAAQSYHPSTNYGANDIRAGASITIPLGGNRNNANSQPRVEFSFQQSRIEQDRLKLDFNRYSLQNAPITNPNAGRVGFTLDKNPQMLVNGRSYRIDGDQKNISTLGIVGIVGGVAVTYLLVVGVLIATQDPVE